MKKALKVLVLLGMVAGAYFLVRISPLLTTDNTGAEKIVLLHGFGRSDVSMLLLNSSLTEAGYDVYNLDYPSIAEVPEALVQIISEDINDCCKDSSATVHFVGHSFGGLLIRDYLGRHRPKNLGRVVLIGTPNKGSELADEGLGIAAQDTLLEWAGPSAQALHTGPDGYAASLPDPEYTVGVIAGTRGNHLSDKWLPIPNDGVVSVESARLDGMTDFIDVEVTHWDMRRDPVIAELVIEFLRHSRFSH
jgi:triacylglycerol esterase/lipase EstA (alpha/beta hydrolase family)